MEEILLRPKTPTDDQLFRELMDRFTVLAEGCFRFSQEVYRRAGTSLETETAETVERNLKIARAVFERRSLETLAVVYMYDSIGFEDLKKALGPISFAFLRGKLRQLEKGGFVQRDTASGGSGNARYSLTHKGRMIARLGEPVFLYLRLADGWRRPATRPAAQPESDGDPSPEPAGPA